MTQSRKIMIVDDEAFIRTLLTQTLEDLEDQDVELLTAGDGEEALELALSEVPDLMFPRCDDAQEKRVRSVRAD